MSFLRNRQGGRADSYAGRSKESPLMEILELINRMGVDQQCLVMAYEDGEPEMCVTLIKRGFNTTLDFSEESCCLPPHILFLRDRR